MATIGFTLLLSSAKIDVDSEVLSIEENLVNHYLKFDLAFAAFSDGFASHQKVHGIDFLVYGPSGKLLSWSEYKVVPSLEEFIFSASAARRIISSRNIAAKSGGSNMIGGKPPPCVISAMI